VKIWDIARAEELRTLKSSGNAVLGSSIAFSPDGKWLAAAGDGVQVWDPANGQEIAILKTSKKAHSVAFTDDGQYLGAAVADGSIEVWNLTTRRRLVVVKGNAGATSLVFSPDGRFAVGNTDGTVRIWEPSTHLGGRWECGILQGHTRAVRSACYSRDGKQ